MHVLMLQFVSPGKAEPRPVFSHSLGVLASLLKVQDISVNLLALGGYQPDSLRKAVIEHRPRYVLAELPLHSATAAHRTIIALAEEFSIPVAIVGQFATCHPTRAASIPGVTAVFLGEYERGAAALMTAISRNEELDEIPGLWLNSADGLVKGPPPTLADDLDSLPAPDRELFDYSRIVSDDREACFKVARGCAMWCAYCPNDWYMDFYADRGPFVRRRSVGNVLDEIDDVVRTYGAVRSIAFYDHAFATDPEWLEQFAEAYKPRFSLPYRCHVRLSQVTDKIAALLAQSGCKCVHTHLGSGSSFIREEILSMRLSHERIIESCGLLRRAGLEIAAEIFVGCPYESQVTIEETLRLVRSSQIHQIHPSVFYPKPGTRAAELCQENGWISLRGEKAERNFWNRKSVLNMPSMPAEHIDAIAAKFHRLVSKPDGAGVRKMLRQVTRTRRMSIRSLFGR